MVPGALRFSRQMVTPVPAAKSATAATAWQRRSKT